MLINSQQIALRIELHFVLHSYLLYSIVKRHVTWRSVMRPVTEVAYIELAAEITV